jgi:alpha-beta hydrolase superfamily lysophospholipase
MEQKIYAIKSVLNLKDEDSVVVTKSYIFSEDKVRLHYVSAKNKEWDKGTIALIPGTYECANDYIPFLTSMAKIGYECHSLDLRGCGLSGGNRYSLNLITMQLDIQELIQRAKSNRLFIIAHSAACVPVLCYLLNNLHITPCGVALLSPILECEEKGIHLIMKIYKLVKNDIYVNS